MEVSQESPELATQRIRQGFAEGGQQNPAICGRTNQKYGPV